MNSRKHGVLPEPPIETLAKYSISKDDRTKLSLLHVCIQDVDKVHDARIGHVDNTNTVNLTILFADLYCLLKPIKGAHELARTRSTGGDMPPQHSALDYL